LVSLRSRVRARGFLCGNPPPAETHGRQQKTGGTPVTNPANFTIGENFWELLTDIAQEKLQCDHNLDAGKKAIKESLIDINDAQAMKILLGIWSLKTEGQELLVRPGTEVLELPKIVAKKLDQFMDDADGIYKGIYRHQHLLIRPIKLDIPLRSLVAGIPIDYEDARDNNEALDYLLLTLDVTKKFFLRWSKFATFCNKLKKEAKLYPIQVDGTPTEDLEQIFINKLLDVDFDGTPEIISRLQHIYTQLLTGDLKKIANKEQAKVQSYIDNEFKISEDLEQRCKKDFNDFTKSEKTKAEEYIATLEKEIEDTIRETKEINENTEKVKASNKEIRKEIAKEKKKNAARIKKIAEAEIDPEVTFTKSDPKEKFNAGWVAPDGSYYGLNGDIANMLHNKLADALYEAGGIIPESEENEANPYQWLDQNGYVKLHDSWVLFGSYDYPESSFEITDEQKEVVYVIGQLHHNGILKLGFEHERVSAAMFKMLDRFMLRKKISLDALK